MVSADAPATADRRTGLDRRGRRRGQARRFPGDRQVRLRRETIVMAEVLVLITLDDGRVSKPALELLTLARRIGEPPRWSSVPRWTPTSFPGTAPGRCIRSKVPNTRTSWWRRRRRRWPRWSPTGNRRGCWSPQPPRARRSAPGSHCGRRGVRLRRGRRVAGEQGTQHSAVGVRRELHGNLGLHAGMRRR